jgi:flagellar protein FlgJ
MTNDGKPPIMLSSNFPSSALLPSRKPPASSAEVKKIAEEFSSLLLSELMKAMRATLSAEGLDGDKSSARDTYSSLADVEVTRSLAKHDGMGLAAFLERGLSRIAPKGDAQETPRASVSKED